MYRELALERHIPNHIPPDVEYRQRFMRRIGGLSENPSIEALQLRRQVVGNIDTARQVIAEMNRQHLPTEIVFNPYRSTWAPQITDGMTGDEWRTRLFEMHDRARDQARSLPVPAGSGMHDPITRRILDFTESVMYVPDVHGGVRELDQPRTRPVLRFTIPELEGRFVCPIDRVSDARFLFPGLELFGTEESRNIPASMYMDCMSARNYKTLVNGETTYPNPMLDVPDERSLGGVSRLTGRVIIFYEMHEFNMARAGDVAASLGAQMGDTVYVRFEQTERPGYHYRTFMLFEGDTGMYYDLWDMILPKADVDVISHRRRPMKHTGPGPWYYSSEFPRTTQYKNRKYMYYFKSRDTPAILTRSTSIYSLIHSVQGAVAEYLQDAIRVYLSRGTGNEYNYHLTIQHGLQAYDNIRYEIRQYMARVVQRKKERRGLMGPRRSRMAALRAPGRGIERPRIQYGQHV